MAFWGLQLSSAKGSAPKAVEDPLSSVLHLSAACIGCDPEKKGVSKVYVVRQLANQKKEEKHVIAVLVGGRQEMASLNLYVDPMVDRFVVEGVHTVHLSGYFEPEGDADSMDSEDDDDEDEEMSEETAAAKKSTEDLTKQLKALGAKEEELEGMDMEEEEEEEGSEEEEIDEKDLQAMVAELKKAEDQKKSKGEKECSSSPTKEATPSKKEKESSAASAPKKESPAVKKEGKLQNEEVESDLEMMDDKDMDLEEEEEEEEEDAMDMEEMLEMYMQAKKRKMELPKDIEEMCQHYLKQSNDQDPKVKALMKKQKA